VEISNVKMKFKIKLIKKDQPKIYLKTKEIWEQLNNSNNINYNSSTFSLEEFEKVVAGLFYNKNKNK